MERLSIEAEAQIPIARVQLTRVSHPTPGEHPFRPDGVYWVDLCLTPRRPNASARYVDRWAAHRFQPMGTVIALPPHERLCLKTGGGQHRSIICQLRAEAVDRHLPDDFEWSDRKLEACLDIASASIRTLLQRLAVEMRHPGLASGDLLEATATLLSIEIARYLTDMREPVETGGLAAWRLRTIDRRLGEQGALPTLAELASLCNMSVRHLTRGFRVSRGCSINIYFAQNRIEAAKRRLADGDSIKAIASSLGFSSQGNFTYAFRRETGVTPSLYKSRMLRPF
jgi:AraC family transcriptional regulator